MRLNNNVSAALTRRAETHAAVDPAGDLMGHTGDARADGIRTVATFWHGPRLSRLDIAGLLSFQRQGFAVEIYSFDDLPGLPREIRARDASQIVDRKFLQGFVVGGKPSLSHFSDLFRYALFQKSDAAWIDTDLLCLRDFVIPATGHFLTKETDQGLNGAILRLDRQSCDLDGLLRTAEGFAWRKDFPWGSTGPRLITQSLGAQAVQQAEPIHHFYPVHWDQWWMPFLPAYADTCRTLCRDSVALHLWNNIIDKAGFWKDLAPPEGSFLYEKLQALGLIDGFRDVMPANVMQTIVNNYLAMQTADTIPLRRLGAIVARRVKTNVLARIGSSPKPGLR